MAQSQFISTQLTGTQSVINQINNTGAWLCTTLQSELSARVRQVSKDIQLMIDKDVAGGAVNFTKRAVMYNFKKLPDDTRINQIIVKPDQTKYLERVLTNDKQQFEKFVPTSNAKLTKEGNISGLRRNIKSGKYKAVNSGGKTYLIDTTKKGKQNDKRIIAVKEEQTRSELFDFYDECLLLTNNAIDNMKGSFTIRMN